MGMGFENCDVGFGKNELGNGIGTPSGTSLKAYPVYVVLSWYESLTPPGRATQ